MHFLLVPYIGLSAMFMVEFRGRAEPTERAGMVVIAAFMSVLMYAAMTLRPVVGDSERYYIFFLEVRELGLLEALKSSSFEPLYAFLTWIVGQMGSAPWLLYGSTLVLYLGTFAVALKRYVGGTSTAALVMCYSAFPSFVSYGVNGMRQGLALVCLLMAYVSLKMGRRSAWIWLAVAPFWHSGAWLAVIVTASHQLMYRCVTRANVRWALLLAGWAIATVLSATALNEVVLSALPRVVEFGPRHEGYFAPTEEVLSVGYRSGFRLDFLLFSSVPLVTAWLLRRRGSSSARDEAGWWLSLYVALNIIYHLCSFVPYADRFAAFSWFLMPLLVFLQVRAAGRGAWMTRFVVAAIVVNVLLLQLYTGDLIARPSGW